MNLSGPNVDSHTVNVISSVVNSPLADELPLALLSAELLLFEVSLLPQPATVTHPSTATNALAKNLYLKLNSPKYFLFLILLIPLEQSHNQLASSH